jgi:NAD(P)H-hydrate repair Nnr-like enzyme with NAD(P)H-hydrate dehydratase domain
MLTLPPLVVDADGLNLLAKIERWHEIIRRQQYSYPTSR